MRAHLHRTHDLGETQPMRPPTTTRAIGLLAAGALLVAACGGNAATTAPTTAPATTAPVTAPPVATEAPGTSTEPGFSFELPSFHADQDLEAMLPDSLGGETLTVLSMTGDQFLGEGTAAPELAAALQALGKTTADLSVAFAGTSQLSVIAFRVKGVPADTLFSAFKDAATDQYTIQSVSYGGKSVQKLTTDGTDTFMYLKDDTMFIVGGSGTTVPTDALLNEAFQKLP